MLTAPLHPDEALRQYTLDSLNLLDTAADVHLDTLVRVAQTAFGVETVLISLIDRDRRGADRRSASRPTRCRPD